MATGKKETLDNWVNNFLLSRNELDYNSYSTRPQIRDAAIRVLRDLSYSSENTYKAVRLDIVGNSHFVPPNDFLKETFIGVLDTSTCQVLPLGRKGSLLTAGDILTDNNGDALLDSKGVELLAEISCTPSASLDLYYDSPYFYQYFYSNSLGRQYGLGGGNNIYGYYRWNNDDDRFEIETNANTTQVILEYVADINLQVNIKFDKALEGALEDGVYYMLIKRLSNVPANEKERARREWVNSRRIGLAVSKASLKQELLQMARKNNINTAGF